VVVFFAAGSGLVLLERAAVSDLCARADLRRPDRLQGMNGIEGLRAEGQMDGSAKRDLTGSEKRFLPAQADRFAGANRPRKIGLLPSE
jgi:hypothetical protein